MTMLWLAIHLPHLPLEALEMQRSIDPSSLVVLAQRGPRRWIVGSRHPDIAVGIDWGTAQAVLPTLRPQMRDLQAERETLDALSSWAWRFGSEVVREIVESPLDYGRPQHRIAINIAPSLRLFGGLDGLIASFDAAFGSTGHAGQRAVAPTLDAAALLARAGADAPVIDPAKLRSALASLPLILLDLPPATLKALRSIGLRNLGELQALPMDGLARRYGPALVERLERLLGMRADGRPRYRPAKRYSRRFDLGSEVETVEGLELPLRRLIQDFAAYLLARDSGVQTFRLTLEHSRQRLSVFQLQLATASRQASRLQRVIRERLAREALPEAVRAVRVSATHFLSPASGQHDLFDPQADEDWLTLLETLTAKLGPDAVHAVAIAQDCRPEKAWRRIAPEVAAAAKRPCAGHAGMTAGTEPVPLRRVALRPLWLVEPPRQLADPPVPLSTAERIEGGWWDGEDVSRDYYRAGLGVSKVWVFQDRRTHQWFLHGLWA